MINSVNFTDLSPLQLSGFDNCQPKNDRQNTLPVDSVFPTIKNTSLPKNTTSFGDYYSNHPIKDALLGFTGNIWNLVGFNAALWFIQEKVNGKLLIGKINKHYTDKIHNNQELTNLAGEMLEKHKLDDKVRFVRGRDGEAFYTAAGNKVVTGSDKASALFHEIGHAVIENKPGVLKFLQDNRNRYTPIALTLYALMSMNQNHNNNVFGNQNQSLGSKIKNFVCNSSLLIPLLAFSPELITEAKASMHGLNFLKEKGIDKALYKNIRNSYAACFGTYLFIPVSIIMMELLTKGIEKEINKNRQRDMYY